MFKKSLLFLSLIACGGILISQNFSFSNQKKKPNWGEIHQVEGLSLGRPSTNEDFKNLQPLQKIPRQFEIKTATDGLVNLQFGEEFQIHNDSHIILSKRNRGYLIIVKGGGVTRRAPHPDVQFYANDKIASGLTVRHQNSHPVNTRNKNQATFQPTLSQLDKTLQQQLGQNLKHHQRFLEKCFIKKSQVADSNLSEEKLTAVLKIAKNGSFTNVQIPGTTTQDKKFLECVIDVLSRVRIKGYKGGDRQIELPIEFSVNN